MIAFIDAYREIIARLALYAWAFVIGCKVWSKYGADMWSMREW